MPFQIIVTRQLDPESSFWISLLSDNLDKTTAQQAVHHSNTLTVKGDKELADSVLQVAVSENRIIFDIVKKEGDKMCQALLELMEPELTEAKRLSAIEGMTEGLREGRLEGRLEGENDFAQLVSCLLKDGLTNILKQIVDDIPLREQYFIKYGIKNREH